MFQTQLDKTNWGYFGFCSQVLLMEGSWVLCLTMSALDVRGLFSGNVLQSPVINDIEFHRNTGVDMKTIELKMRPDTFHFWYFHSFAALSYFVLHPWIDIRLAVLSEIIDFIGGQAFLRVAILRLEIFRCLQAHNFSTKFNQMCFFINSYLPLWRNYHISLSSADNPEELDQDF